MWRIVFPTLAMRSHPRPAIAVVVGTVLFSVSAARSAPTPEDLCQAGRYIAAGKYSNSQQRVHANSYARSPGGGYGSPTLSGRFAKSTAKYTATWPKLQAKASGTGATCDAPRFADNLDGTVTDNLTGLQWEKKTGDASVHNKDNLYTWSATGTAADGTAYTDFLATLNSGGCFAGQCDWRLPTLAELQTIVLASDSCGTNPCIDTTFGPTTADSIYWSATSILPSDRSSDHAWVVWFGKCSGGEPLPCYPVGTTPKFYATYVRAVRAGL